MKRTIVVTMMALGLLVPAVAGDDCCKRNSITADLADPNYRSPADRAYEAFEERSERMNNWLHQQRMESELDAIRQEIIWQE